jgi:hypothetical protein
MPRCSTCQTATVKTPRRKYCSALCAKEAIRRLKRALRQQTLNEFRAGRTTVPPWREGWTSDEARKAYFREYMRRWRRRRRETAVAPCETYIAA